MTKFNLFKRSAHSAGPGQREGVWVPNVCVRQRTSLGSADLAIRLNVGRSFSGEFRWQKSEKGGQNGAILALNGGQSIFCSEGRPGGIGGPKGSVAVLGRNRRNDTSVFGAILEPRGAHWRSILGAFVDNFRDGFSATFWRAFLVVLGWAR